MTRTTRVTQVLSLLLVTLTMGQLYAHVLELGPKMHYPPELYLRLNTSLYAWYGPPLGAAINTGAVIATGALAWMVHRQRSALLLTGTAFALQVAELANYFARVEPVNVRFRALSPGQVPSDFIALRAQWEYGHALGFALYALAFLLLVLSLVGLVAPRVLDADCVKRSLVYSSLHPERGTYRRWVESGECPRVLRTCHTRYAIAPGSRSAWMVASQRYSSTTTARSRR